jgi:hypothetical protein
MDTENHSSESEQGLVKVILDLSKDDGPVASESLWAEPAGNLLFRLRNVPFFAYGFSERDIVRVEESGGKLVVTAIEERGGHSTYRIFLPTETTEERFAGDWELFERLGCTYERANRRLVAIDVPPRADIYAVYTVLEDGEKDGLWEFEEGHCGHALRGQTPAKSDERGNR